MNEILIAREERSHKIHNYNSDYPIVVIKANIPGLDKNIRAAYFLVNIFKEEVISKFKYQSIKFYESYDGPYFILEIDLNHHELKEKLIQIEENHPLGRLIDLDVFYKNIKSISRNDLNLKLRKCLICEKDAVFCAVNRTHSIEELLGHIDDMILGYLKKEIKLLIDEAITLEARLDPKFGLVTAKSNGSHNDMDYLLLEKTKRVIIEDLTEMFAYGYQYQLDEAFEKARILGKKTEEKMFKETSNVNTYKGLIFVLGIVLISVGRCFKENKCNLYDNIKYISRNILDELNDQSDDTFGKIAYKKYNITGIRGEVHSGLENVRKVINKMDDFSNQSLTMTLIRLIKCVDDTVLLKRAKSLEKYEYYRNLIGDIEEYNIEKINQVTNECIKEYISFGGSADLLVVAIFIKKVEERFKIDYEKKESNWSI